MEKSLWQQTYDDLACSCNDIITCRRVFSNATVHLVRQCRVCGKNYGGVKKSDFTDDQIEAMPLYSEEISEQFHQKVSVEFEKRRKRFQQTNREEFFDWYNEYLKSDEWQRKRGLILERASYICEGCGIKTATQVHHKTYDRVGKEMLFDLVAICDDCHIELHKHMKVAINGEPAT